MANCRWRRRHVHVLMRNVLKKGDQVDFLLIVSTDRRTGLLTNDGNDAGVIHLGIVQAIEEMNGTGPGCSKTNTDFACELGVRTSHECRHFFMPHLHVLDSAIGTIKSANYAVNAVPWITVDAF